MIPYRVIKLSRNGEHLCYYEFDLDGGESFSYRARTSGNSYFYGLKNRNFDDKNWAIYHGKHANDPFYAEDNVPTIKLNSLWEFYEHIGFDYKTNRYE